jgi:pyruvate dehydrogenase E2 component (dihydrolipoamide acetyltransferase)
MPKLSPTMDAGMINKWVKKEGDKVTSGDTLAEVETDKASMPLETFDDGVILKILVPEGKAAKIDELVAVIGKAGEDISAILASGGAPAKAAAPAAKAATNASGAPTVAVPTATSVAASTSDARVRVSPLAKKIAKERGVNLSAIQATGPGGRIIARDVSNAPAGGANGANGSGGGTLAQGVLPGPIQPGDTDLPLSGVRQTIARRLLQSKQTVPHFYLYNEVQVDKLLLWREEINAQIKEGQPKISINDLVIKIAAITLQRHPECNAAFNQTSIRRFGSIDIAVAVATEDGLYTPVLRKADKLSLSAISKQVKELAGKAREKKLRIEELTGSSFTISNLGMFGLDHFFAIINPPEAAILAVGGIKAKPVVNAAGQVVAGKTMGISLSLDHRVIDGAVGAKFMQTMSDLLEHPAKLLL